MDLDRYDWSHRASETLQRRLVRRVDKIVTNSQSGREFAASRGFPSDRQVVIPNGIDPEQFAPDPSKGQALRAKWGLTDDARVIGIAARLDPMKDHVTFLRAAAIAAKQNPSLHFVCVGDGQAAYRVALHNQASNLGLDDRLTWAGHHRNMAEVYNALDVATLTSAFGEGFPNAVGEAMACGTPCVVTDVGDAVDIIGETGLHAAVGDAETLAREWMELVAQSPQEKADRETACRARIVEKYSVATMVEAHRSFYQQLAQSTVSH
jgi:glycosyltransferase involved in cell wall biosynthesis